MNNPVSRYISNVARSASELSKARSEASATKFAKLREDVKSQYEGTQEYRNRMEKLDPIRSSKKVQAAEKKAKEEMGQFIGAVLQNRTYVDRKTGKAIK